jgi:hypothetical protein
MLKKNFILNLTIMFAALFAMAGCDVINDDEGDCSSKYVVRFRYIKFL